MIAAAGILIIAPCPVSGVDTALMMLRGAGSDHPFEWAFPGGQIEAGETPAQGAARECEEECGLTVDPGDLGQPLTRGIARAEALPAPVVCPCCNGPCACPPTCGACSCNAPSQDVDFTTFLHRVDRQFTPVMCDEHIGHCWAPLDRPPLPVHPGAAVALARPTMNELGVARAMAAGQLVSPQLYENMALFAIRITATGAAYRTSLGEYVWRDPGLYLNDDFLARCAGLPVIWEHPAGSTLNSDEYDKRNIGAVMMAYIQGNEVWAIARTYDVESIKEMVESQVSTSPAVVFFKGNAGNERATLEDGSRVLIETSPDLLDHIAICSAGVWDKGRKPSGVDRTAALLPGDLAMADGVVRTLQRTDFRGRALSLRARTLGLRART